MAKAFNFNSTYFIDKPVNKRTASYEKWWMFSVKERNGDNITFSNRDRNDHKDYNTKVLTSLQTGDEVCYITIDGEKYLIRAANCFSKGRKLSELSEEEKQTILSEIAAAEKRID